MPLTLFRHGTQKPPLGPTQADRSHPLSQNLLAAWLFNEIGSTQITDQSLTKSGGTGTLNATPTWISSTTGPGVSLNGSTQNITGTGLLPIFNGPYTVSVLLAANTTSPGQVGLIRFGNQGSLDQTIFLQANNTGASAITLSQWSDDLNTAWTWVANSVLRITATCDSAKLQTIYVNGAPNGATRTATAFSNGNNLWFIGSQGGIGFANFTYYDGFCWNRALSASEVTQHHAEPYAMFQARPLQRWFVIASIQQSLPASDLSVGTWTTNTGATSNLYQAIDETTANDADYIQSVAGPASSAVEVALGAVADPLSNANHVVDVRALIDQVVGGTVSLLTELRQNGAALSTPASWTDTLTTTVQTFPHTLSSTQADAISDYSQLSYLFTASQGATATPTFVGAGTAAWTATNNATFTPTINASTAVGDYMLLVIQRNDTTVAPTVTGWTNIAALTGTNSTTQSAAVYSRVFVAADAGPAVTFGTSTVARGGVILSFRSVGPTTPIHLSSLLNVASTATIVGSTNITSTINNTLGVFIALNIGLRSTTNTTTNWTAGTGVTAFASQNTTVGNDLTIGYGEKTFDVAGSYLTPGITWTTNTTTGVGMGLLISLAPIANNSRAQITWADFEIPLATIPVPPLLLIPTRIMFVR